ncbi:Phosphoethanolamine transferase EptA [Planctomycetes bacterium Poly30]|uniref:Phosphoethanolamine transferase EptA n=1 Tax=Saltatorellus ferox TaxID=2528018 RepID=A0A518EMD4_9BACT|nr:Phosphoethanolamine transferase EptA [Planctomycetes bacterium Poly30]
MTLDRSRWQPRTTTFIVLMAAANALLYHAPLFSFAADHLEVGSFSGILTLVTALVALFSSTALLLSLLALVSHRLLKPICMVLAITSSIAVYFVATYQVVLDRTMMGNVQNTNLAESLELFHPKLLVYLALLGLLPAGLLAGVRVEKSPRLRVAAMAASVLVLTVTWGWMASGTWGWIDKNAKRLGGLVMPWSYVMNTVRSAAPKLWQSDVQILLPEAAFTDDEKSVVLLVIGESARAQNFSLYGYERPTNPQLEKAGAEALQSTMASSTYTTASVRCILSHVDSSSEFSTRYEPLPSYLQRHGVDVIWRSKNTGEPPIQVQTYETARELARDCPGPERDYDEVVLTGLEERIRSSSSQKILVVLHQAGSHGPSYSTKYPIHFEVFRQVCESVELGTCSEEELYNAYDNTILYTDQILSRTIDVLKRIPAASPLLIYISDHGESLGEYGLYLHGAPWMIAPDVQKAVPFIVWMSEEFTERRNVHPAQLQAQTAHSQRDIFHTILGALSIQSEVYEEEYDIFNESFSNR